MKVCWFTLLVMTGCEIKDRVIDVFFASDEIPAIEEQCQPDPNDQGDQIEVCKQPPVGVSPTPSETPSEIPSPGAT